MLKKCCSSGLSKGGGILAQDYCRSIANFELVSAPRHVQPYQEHDNPTCNYCHNYDQILKARLRLTPSCLSKSLLSTHAQYAVFGRSSSILRGVGSVRAVVETFISDNFCLPERSDGPLFKITACHTSASSERAAFFAAFISEIRYQDICLFTLE